MKHGTQSDPKASEPAILPCPFCGSDAVELDEDPAAGACGDVDVWVVCQTCEATGPRTRIGCRDDADDDYDWRPQLQREAADGWNEAHSRWVKTINATGKTVLVHMGDDGIELRRTVERLESQDRGTKKRSGARR